MGNPCRSIFTRLDVQYPVLGIPESPQDKLLQVSKPRLSGTTSASSS